MASSGSTEVVRAEAAQAVLHIHKHEQGFNHATLRPCIPTLLQMLRCQHEHVQTAAVFLLWDMTHYDREFVGERLATHTSLSALADMLGSSSGEQLGQAAAYVLCNLSTTRSGRRGLLAASQLLVPKLVSVVNEQIGSEQTQRRAMACFRHMFEGQRVAATRALAAVSGVQQVVDASRTNATSEHWQRDFLSGL